MDMFKNGNEPINPVGFWITNIKPTDRVHKTDPNYLNTLKLFYYLFERVFEIRVNLI